VVNGDLGRPQAVPEGEQDHGGVAVTVQVALRGLDQRRHLVDREVLTGPELGVLSSFRVVKSPSDSRRQLASRGMKLIRSGFPVQAQTARTSRKEEERASGQTDVLPEAYELGPARVGVAVDRPVGMADRRGT
jgi:hypothetical protein